MKVFLPILLAVIATCNAAHLPEDAAAKQWALLVAGSSGFDNYRHQADIAHAYKILIRRGIPAANIVVMMYDDVAHDPSNPQPGKLINKPNGHDVYKGIKIDYKGADVTPQNFLNVLAGNKKALHGVGTGRVVESGPNDHVFVNFADHGGSGILCFPEDDLNASDLIKTLKSLTKNKRYSRLVLYIEACEAGSNFAGLLPANTEILASTASNPTESSWACYCSYKDYPCLGDVYSVKWMEHMDKKVSTSETLLQQYNIVKKLTTTSHVTLYGDKRVRSNKVNAFLGAHNGESDEITSEDMNAVSSRDAPLYYYKRMAKEASTEEKRAEFAEKVVELEAKRQFIDTTVNTIIEKVADNDNGLVNEIVNERHDFTEESLECHVAVYKHFSNKCFNLNKNQYVLKHFYKFANICHKGGDYQEKAMDAIDSVCPEAFPAITGAK